MIQVKLTTNDLRTTVIVPKTQTIRKVLEDNNINYANTPIMLDGTTLTPGSFDKTFAEIGITERCILAAVVKTNNA